MNRHAFTITTIPAATCTTIKENGWTEISMENDFKVVFANLPRRQAR